MQAPRPQTDNLAAAAAGYKLQTHSLGGVGLAQAAVGATDSGTWALAPEASAAAVAQVATVVLAAAVAAGLRLAQAALQSFASTTEVTQ